MLIASCSLHHLLSLFFPQSLYLALSQSLPFAEFWLIVFLCLSVPVKKVSIGSTDIYVLWIILLDKWTYWRLPGKARLLSLLNAFTICISTSIANQLSNLEWCIEYFLVTSCCLSHCQCCCSLMAFWSKAWNKVCGEQVKIFSPFILQHKTHE